MYDRKPFREARHRRKKVSRVVMWWRNNRHYVLLGAVVVFTIVSFVKATISIFSQP